MKCSLYIPVFNERDALRRTLRSLIPEKDGHEVFVVDRGSVDGSLDVVKEHDWVTLLTSGEGMLSAALNQAATGGEGEILLFLQAGAVPVRGWSAAVDKTFSQPVDAGHFTLVEADASSKSAAALRALANKLGKQLLGGPTSLSGLAVKRATFQNVHGFSPVPDFEWLAFAQRVRESGGKVVPIPHEIQQAPRPGSRQSDAWEELFDDLKAAWRYRNTESFDPVRCRRKTAAAVLLAHDLFPGEDTATEYFAYAREALLTYNLELLQSYRGVQRTVFMGGKDTTKALGQPSGVLVCPHIRTELSKRFEKILTQLETDGVDGVLLVRGVCKQLTHARLRELSELTREFPCNVLANEEGTEWLALWIDTPSLPLFHDWDLSPALDALQKRFYDREMKLEVIETPARAFATDHDARAMYYAGLVDRLPA